MTLSLTEQFVADILMKVLNLTEDRIWLANQRTSMPLDTGLYITVGRMAVPTVASNKRIVSTDTGLKEVRTQHVEEIISIDIESADSSAFDRFPEVIGALQSSYAQEMQERYGFKIGTTPTTANSVAPIEAASVLYHMSITVRVLRAYSSESAIPYYDNSFTTQTRNEKGTV